VQQVRLLVDPGRQPATMKRLRSFETRQQTARFRLRHHFDWKVNPVSTVGFHLFVRQHSPHVDAPSLTVTTSIDL
jgi:nitric oxide synthase oxygenase domain/subunit